MLSNKISKTYTMYSWIVNIHTQNVKSNQNKTMKWKIGVGLGLRQCLVSKR